MTDARGLARRWPWLTRGRAARLLVLPAVILCMLTLHQAQAAFTATTTDAATFAAAATFPTYPTSVAGNTPWAYHRSDDAVSNAATSTAADTSGNSRPGIYSGSTNGPVLHWAFDEGSGTSTQDTSGAGNTGTVRTGATWSAGLGGSGAITSDGTNMPATSVATQPIRADRSFTVSAWAYMTGSTVNDRVVAGMTKTTPSVNPRSDWALMFAGNSGSPHWSFVMARDPTSSTNTGWDWLYGTTTPAQNSWTHLVAVYDTSVAGGTMYLYVNGTLESSMTHTALNNTTALEQFDLGRWRNGSTGGFWIGSLDEARAYQRALSSTEVTNLYESLPEVKWDFSESSGTTTADSGVNGNTGTLGSATSFTAGHVGNAVSMSGSANGYVQSATQAVNTDMSFSVSAWVYLNSAGTGSTRSIVSEPGGTSSPFSLNYNSGGKWRMDFPRSDTTGPPTDYLESTATAATNTWVHLVGVYDDENDLGKFYVNGTLNDSNAQTDPTEWDATGAMQVGREWWNGAWNYPWYGKVDSVRVYQRALTATEIGNLYADTDPAAPFTEAAMTAGIPGALQGAQQGQAASTAVAFNGTSNAYNNTQISAPGPVDFTTECWFMTSSTTGGQIMGYTNDKTNDISSSRDRMVYLDSANHLTFGIFSGSNRTVRSAVAYNDGAWHHLATSYGAAGLKLYVDGALVASDPNYTQSANPAGAFAGYWRWGGGSINGWPNRPTNDFFTGTLDEVAIYTSQLTDQQIARHFYADH